MKIVEYKKHLLNGVLVDPEWIVKGGEFYDSNTKTFIGLVLPEEERGYYIPDTVVYMTIEELYQRVIDHNTSQPYIKSKIFNDNGPNTKTYYTNEELKQWVDNFLEFSQS